MTHSDPDARAGAIEALVEREGRSAQGEVIVALSDPDPQVRARALYANAASRCTQAAPGPFVGTLP